MARMIASDDEQRLISHVLNGHPEAFRTLMDGYADYVVRIVGQLIPWVEEAREVVQDTFVGAYRSLASYDASKASVATWLARIAWHKAADHLRHRKPTPLYMEEHGHLLDGITDEMADTVFAEATTGRIEQLRAAIRRLPPDDQTLLRLYYTDDRPLKEIAYITGRTPAYLATRLQRIRKRLYIIIQNQEQHDQGHQT